MANVVADHGSIVAPDGRRWEIRTCTRRTELHWEGWIEFIPLSPGERAIRTPTETTQPDREAMVQWAGGLTAAYFEGALARALERPAVVEKEVAPPLFDEPAPSVVSPTLPPAHPTPILDPFEVFAQGEEILASQLAALGTEHIRDIVQAYEMTTQETARVASRGELTAFILSAVRERAARLDAR